MNSRFFLTVFITLIFHLGFSQNIIKNGTFKGKSKRTKSFKKSSSRLLNKKGEFTAKSKSNSMIKQSLMDFNGQYRMQNFFLSTSFRIIFKCHLNMVFGIVIII